MPTEHGGLFVSGPREGLWCGLEVSTPAPLLLHTSLLPKEQGLPLLHCPMQGWFKAFIPSKAQPLCLCQLHSGHGCLESQESSIFPGSDFHDQRKKSHLFSAREGEFLSQVALRCLRTWGSPGEKGDGHPCLGEQ